MSTETGVSAEVILDSVSPMGQRVTTVQATMHRFVLAEANTHRVWSRNSASSRAIPVSKRLATVSEYPAFPISWPAEQPGMQGGSELEGTDLAEARELFRLVCDNTVSTVQLYLDGHPDKSTRLHKSLLNRLLEPFLWHTVTITCVDWDGFFDQRCSPLAQPEMEAVAVAIRDALAESDPTLLMMDADHTGGWHMPYLDGDVIDWAFAFAVDRGLEVTPLEAMKSVSAARCARTSFLTQDGVRDPEKDLDLCLKLLSANPMHASPFEHVCRPSVNPHELGNLRGFRQWRHDIEAGIR